MAKESGLGWTTFNVDDDGGTARDIRNDTTNLSIATPYNTQDVTGLDKSAVERLALLGDFSGTGNGVFNDAANFSHAVLSGDLRVARTIGIVVSGQTLNNEALITDYALTRAAGGEFTWQAPFALSDGTIPNWT
jgi:hypothetical protein